MPSFIQIGQPEVGERARKPDDDKQTDMQSDNKGRLELSGAREPTERQTERQTGRQDRGTSTPVATARI